MALIGGTPRSDTSGAVSRKKLQGMMSEIGHPAALSFLSIQQPANRPLKRRAHHDDGPGLARADSDRCLVLRR